MLASKVLTGHHNFSHRKEKSNTRNTICRHNEEKNLAKTKNLPKQKGENVQITNIKRFHEMKRDKMLNGQKKNISINIRWLLPPSVQIIVPVYNPFLIKLERKRKKNIFGKSLFFSFLFIFLHVIDYPLRYLEILLPCYLFIYI